MAMSTCSKTEDTQQQLVQPPSLLGDDDFEVIDNGQSISPYEMSLLPPQPQPLQKLAPKPLDTVDGDRYPNPATGHQSEPLQATLLTRLDEAMKRFTSLRNGLTDNNVMLEHLNAKLTTQSISKTSIPNTNCQDCQPARQELSRLRLRQEEWLQTCDDYAKLKSQYDLLTNTRERLVVERDELAQRLQQQQQQQQPKPLEFDENRAATEQLTKRVTELETLLQGSKKEIAELTQANETLKEQLASVKEIERQSSQEAKQLVLEVKELREGVALEQAKLLDAEIRYSDSLNDLRKSANIRELERLRRELETREKLYGESDQAVNDILRVAEETKAAVHDENVLLKRKLHDAEACLMENRRRTEALAAKEMELKEQVAELEQRLARRVDEHCFEVQSLKEELSNAQLLHRQELDSERQNSRFRAAKLDEAERRCETLEAEAERLRQTEAKLRNQCRENDRTINDILASTETDKQAIQSQVNDLTARLANAEEQLRRRELQYQESMVAISNLQRNSEHLNSRRAALEGELADCKLKCDQATELAEKFRREREDHANYLSELDSKLSELQFEHTKVRTSHNQLEHRLAECSNSEQSWKLRASQAEANMEEFRRSMCDCQRAFEQESKERAALQQERDSLREQLNRVRNVFNS